MDGETRSGIFGSRHRQGFFLMEALLLALIIALAAASVVPVYSEWEDEKRLDLAAAEACALIRSAQQEAKNGTADISGGGIEEITVRFAPSGGRVKYSTVRGVYSIKPSGYLPKGIVMNTTAQINFKKDGFAGGSGDYSFILFNEKRTKGRRITVAMYTGRVRAEDFIS